jgi:hypothetical protein
MWELILKKPGRSKFLTRLTQGRLLREALQEWSDEQDVGFTIYFYQVAPLIREEYKRKLIEAVSRINNKLNSGNVTNSILGRQFKNDINQTTSELKTYLLQHGWLENPRNGILRKVK